MIVVKIGPIRSQLIGEIPEEVLHHLRHDLSFEYDAVDMIKAKWELKNPYTLNAQENAIRNKIVNWDGRRVLITDKMKFYTGLLARVIGILDSHQLEYQFVDERYAPSEQEFNPLRMDIQLRGYQREAIQAALKNSWGTIRIPTGGGKTRVAAGILSEISRPSLFLVTRRDLMYQTVKAFHSIFHYDRIGFIGDGEWNPNFITVATVQSLCAALEVPFKLENGEKPERVVQKDKGRKNLALALLGGIDVVIFDEVQNIASRTSEGIMGKVERARWRFGLSATDWRNDNSTLLLEALVGPRIYDINMSHLVQHGYAVPAMIRTFTLPAPANGWSYVSATTWDEVYKYYHVENVKFHNLTVDIIGTWLDHGRTILTLVTSVKHGKTLASLCAEKGIKAVFLSGRDATKIRAETLGRVERGELRCLIATSIADEGLDLPVLDALILAGGGKSSTKAIQRIGRIIRPYGKKTEGWVADFYCNDHVWLKKQYEIRQQIFSSEPSFSQM